MMMSKSTDKERNNVKHQIKKVIWWQTTVLIFAKTIEAAKESTMMSAAKKVIKAKDQKV